MDRLSSQFLSFKLEEETYAIPIANVREVLRLPDMTRIPGAPDFVRGVINVRGTVVPVVDLKRKFGGPITTSHRLTRVVIVESRINDKTVVLGSLADSVEEVMELPKDRIEPTPEVGIQLKTDFITGIGKRDEEFIILLDVIRVFSAEELIHLQQVRKSPLATASEHG